MNIQRPRCGKQMKLILFLWTEKNCLSNHSTKETAIIQSVVRSSFYVLNFMIGPGRQKYTVLKVSLVVCKRIEQQTQL